MQITKQKDHTVRGKNDFIHITIVFGIDSQEYLCFQNCDKMPTLTASTSNYMFMLNVTEYFRTAISRCDLALHEKKDEDYRPSSTIKNVS